MSPVDQLKLTRELANKREYSPEEARKNIENTLIGVASVTPILANSLSVMDAINARNAAKNTDDPEEKKRLNAWSVASALLAAAPFRIGNPSPGSATRFGTFVPVAEQGRADMAREMFRNLPKNYSRPDRANKAVFQQTRTFFGPGGEAKEVLPDAEMEIIRKLHGGDVRPLGEIIDHPQLFERFPETAQIPVEILPKIRNSTGEGYNRPIARSEGAGFQISENGKPRWIKDNIAKLLQYNIAEKHGFPAAASHSLDESIAKMDRVIAAVRDGLKSESVPAGAAVSYLDKLEKTRGRLLLAQEAAKSDASRSPWLREKFPGMEGPLEAREARRAISKALNDRMAGNIDAKLSQRREAAAGGQYPYTGQSLGEMIVLPQQTEDMVQLAEFLKNWRTYGQGAPQGPR